MTRNELKTQIEDAEKQIIGLQDEIKNLKAKLDAVQDVEIPDMPVFHANEIYWRMYPTLEYTKNSVIHSDYNGEGYNRFHTKEYADEFADKCKLIAMMLHCKWYLCCDYHPDFNNGITQKWTVIFNHNVGKFTVEFSRVREWGTIYFDTEENAQKAADWMNKYAKR